MPIYCGNNRLSNKLVDGNYELGTRYKCLKKGIMTGQNMPYDSEYAGEYEPIIIQKIYCGNKNNLPEEYDRFGSITECLQKGIGLGKRIKATSRRRRTSKRRKSKTKRRRRNTSKSRRRKRTSTRRK